MINYSPPTLQQLYSEEFEAEEFEALNLILSANPKPEWIKKHPYIKNHKYLPIERVEFLLRKIFKDTKIEITNQGTSFNGVWVTVRVHYYHPVKKEYLFHDGIGACPLQTKKYTSPADLQNISNGAISMAFPIAKTLAIKDACDHFGNLFGANLNRKDEIPFSFDTKLIPQLKDFEVFSKKINECNSIISLERLVRENKDLVETNDLYQLLEIRKQEIMDDLKPIDL